MEQIAVVLFGVVIATLTLGMVFGPIALVQRRRAARLQALNPGSQVWIVGAGQAIRYLVLTATSIAIVNHHNEGDSWPVSQVRGLELTRTPVGRGIVSGTGLAIDLEGSRLRIIFPWPGGLWASRTTARSALTAIDAHRPSSSSTERSHRGDEAVSRPGLTEASAWSFRNMTRIELLLAWVGAVGLAVLLAVNLTHGPTALVFAALAVFLGGGLGSRFLYWRRTSK